MAVKDVREYYYNLLMQKIEMNQDLEEFKKLFADGLITEDKLTNVVENVNIINSNFERASYIMYLLEQPNRASKKQKWVKNNKQLAEHFHEQGADLEYFSSYDGTHNRYILPQR